MQREQLNTVVNWSWFSDSDSVLSVMCAGGRNISSGSRNQEHYTQPNFHRC